MSKRGGKGGGWETYRHGPYDALVCGPAVPDQSGGIEEGGDPGVFAHAVFGAVDELAGVVVAVGAPGFAGHDGVGPSAAEEGGEDVADGAGDVGQADLDGAEIVGWFGEGGFQADVQEVEGAEGDGGVVDCDGDGGEAEVEDDLERVDKGALEPLYGGLGFLMDGLPRCRPFQFCWHRLCLPWWFLRWRSPVLQRFR